ncbi:MAG: SpoIID/LytB domain-containing protein [Lachnospiraceae bacterium]
MRVHNIKHSIILLVGILFLLGTACSREVSVQSDKTLQVETTNMARCVAFRALALAFTDRENCQNAPRFYFLEEQQDSWYVPYMCWLYENQIIDFEEISPTSEIAQGNLLCGEVKKILTRLNLSDVAKQYLQSTDETVVSAQLWWMIYDEILESFNGIDAVKKINLKIWGTPKNIAGAKQWCAYTDDGEYYFEGLTLDFYVDKELEVLVRNGAIIYVCGVVSDSVTYENVWISECQDTKVMILYDGIYRQFTSNTALKEGSLADISVSKGKLGKVILKEEKIEGRLLAVGDEFVQVRGYGEIVLSKQAQFYDLSYGEGQVTSVRKEDLVAGEGSLEFILVDGICCGILRQKEEAVQNIRVLICSDGWSSNYHSQVCLTSSGSFSVTMDETSFVYQAGTILIFDVNTKFPTDQVILVESLEDAGIQLLSVNRNLGNPTYEGSIEISRREEGLLIVNELPLETYLTYVVPSEMPARYGLEAAKVQAVCARSYAWKQMHSNSCASFGAHVDDSTNYQVYNNILRQDVSTQGVLETAGEILMVGNEILTAYYFSTSCGSTTDLRSWGSSEAGYTKTTMLTLNGEILDLANEEVFRSFIQNWDYPAWESSEVWYRWKCSIDWTELSQLLDSRLNQMFQTMPDMLFAEDETGNLRSLTEVNLGEVQDITVTKRLEGGAVDEIRICGSLQTIRVNHQTAIRTLLGDSSRLYENRSSAGMSTSEGSLLPSPFFCLTREEGTNNLVIWGGGNGHGIGMTQNGAYRMAEAGMTYQEILQKFYPTASIEVWEQ